MLVAANLTCANNAGEGEAGAKIAVRLTLWWSLEVLSL